jgi:thiol-disulfide isomerase/thioredoxin
MRKQTRSFMQRLVPVVLFASLVAGTAEAKLKKGDTFPSDSVPTLDGKGKLDISKYKGKVVIVDFWASWCEPCKIELPALNALQKKYKDKLVVVGVNLDEKKADANTFLKSHPVQLTLGYDGDKQVLAKKAEIETMPTSFIVDKNGVIQVRHQGFREDDAAKIEKEIKELMK